MPTVPVPTDPRTPLKRAEDQLAAANRELAHEHPSHARRRDLADRIRRLQHEIDELKALDQLASELEHGRVSARRQRLLDRLDQQKRGGRHITLQGRGPERHRIN